MGDLVQRVVDPCDGVVELSDTAPARLRNSVDLGAEFGANNLFTQVSDFSVALHLGFKHRNAFAVARGFLRERLNVVHQTVFELLVFGARRLIKRRVLIVRVLLRSELGDFGVLFSNDAKRGHLRGVLAQS